MRIWRASVRSWAASSAEYGAAPPSFFAVALHADGVREYRRPLLALFGGVNLLLAMACVNVANLLIARAAARRREMAMRIALGASLLRLLRLAMVEGLLLAAAGAIVGSAIAAGGLKALLAMRPTALERIASASLDLRVLGFTAATSFAWGVLFSLAPFAEAMRLNVSTAVRDTAGAAGNSIGSRIRYALVVGEVAFGLVLLVSAMLLVRGFARLQNVDVGLSRRPHDHVSRCTAGRHATTHAEARMAFARAGHQIERVHAARRHLRQRDHPSARTTICRTGARLSSGGPDRSDRSHGRRTPRAILPDFFATVRAQIVEGRDFTTDDDFSKMPVAIVDTRLAARAWPGQSAVGKRLISDPQTTGTPETLVTVVGVVQHLRHRTPGRGSSRADLLSAAPGLPQPARLRRAIIEQPGRSRGSHRPHGCVKSIPCCRFTTYGCSKTTHARRAAFRDSRHGSPACSQLSRSCSARSAFTA